MSPTLPMGLQNFLSTALRKNFQLLFLNNLKILFPETRDVLNLIDQKIYQFSAYLAELRDAFIIDLNNLPYHIPDVLDLEKYDSFFSISGREWIKPVVKSAAFIADGLIRKDSVLSAGNMIE